MGRSLFDESVGIDLLCRRFFASVLLVINGVVLFLYGKNYTHFPVLFKSPPFIFILLGVCFLLLYGWVVGKPLILRNWLNGLSEGNYREPVDRRGIPRSQSKKGGLKRSYRIYESLISRLNQLSEVLKQSEKDREKLEMRKREWAAGVTHDLKTPLSYIQGYSSMLLSEDHRWSDGERKQALQQIQEQSEHLGGLIRDLVITYRLEEQQIPLNKEKTELVDWLRHLMIEVANVPESRSCDMQFDTSMEACTYPLDRSAMKRALTNLLMNAAGLNPPGTRVTLSLRRHRESVEIHIRDDGKGMDEEQLNHLFDRRAVDYPYITIR